MYTANDGEIFNHDPNYDQKQHADQDDNQDQSTDQNGKSQEIDVYIQ